MKLVVLGATGGTGLEIVRRALQKGHAVTAFVRSPEKLTPFLDRIRVRQGNPLDRDEAAAVIQGHDAVLSGFGPRVPISPPETDLLERFAVVLTSAMRQAAVRRVVVVSTAFLFKNSIVPPAHLVGRLFFSGIMADAAAMERVIGQSGLDWTVVRPPQLTDQPYTGKYRVGEDRLPVFGFKISRADVADFLLKTAEDRASVGKILGVSN